MTRWVVLGILVCGLVLLQHFGLERTEEKRQEAVYTNIKDLPPGDMVPMYVGSLFLGSFRAVAIDILWIQLDEAREEGRWYLAREISEMISRLQPHNEEVWAMLSHDAAYNVAEGERERGEERAWPWIRYGLLRLREGVRFNPKTVYLRNQLGFFLWHKPSWRTGQLDLDLLDRIEKDDELQLALQNVHDREPTEAEKREILKNRKSSFELAILWFRESIAALGHRDPNDPLFTQMGLALREDTMEGYIRVCMYLQGVYVWKRAERSADSAEWEAARLWFARAKEQAETMYRNYGWGILEEHARFYARLPEVLDASRALVAAPAGEAWKTARGTYVQVLDSIARECGYIDDGHLRRPLSDHRIDLSQEVLRGILWKDEDEFNDLDAYASGLVAGQGKVATLTPRGDVDVHAFLVRGGDQPGNGFKPVTVTLHVLRVGQLPLRVTVRFGQKVLKEYLVEGTEDVPEYFKAERPGSYYVEVRPATAPDPHPADTRYGILVEVGD